MHAQRLMLAPFTMQVVVTAMGVGNQSTTCEPIVPTSFYEQPIVQFQSGQFSGNFDFSVMLSAVSLPQSFFTSVSVQQTNGVWRTYLSSAATYGSGGPGLRFWFWGAGGNRVWTSGSVLGQRFGLILSK